MAATIGTKKSRIFDSDANTASDFLLGDIGMAKNDNLHKAKDAKNDEFYSDVPLYVFSLQK